MQTNQNSVFYASVFNSNDELWDPWSTELEDCDCDNDKILVNKKKNVWGLLLQLDTYKSMWPNRVNLKLLRDGLCHCKNSLN